MRSSRRLTTASTREDGSPTLPSPLLWWAVMLSLFRLAPVPFADASVTTHENQDDLLLDFPTPNQTSETGGTTRTYLREAIHAIQTDRLPSGKRDAFNATAKRPNLLFIVADQLRFDCLRFMQDRLTHYAGKLKVRTPNVDRLVQRGTVFTTAYCASSSCAPARTSLKTGTTLQRSGVTSNLMVRQHIHQRMDFVKRKVEALVSFEQILADQLGYRVESYGKWHVPQRLYYSSINETTRIIDSTTYDFPTDTFSFDPEFTYESYYKHTLQYLLNHSINTKNLSFAPGQQLNNYSNFAYEPIRLDARYGFPTNTPLALSSGLQPYQLYKSHMKGRDSLNASYTPSAILGRASLRALDRLIMDHQSNTSIPFALSVHFVPPHPPMIASSQYLDYYWSRRDEILVPESIGDTMENSAYAHSNGRKYQNTTSSGYSDPAQVQELTAVYYALVQEVDHWIGQLVDRLEAGGLENDTMIVVTSDHGEMLAAHSMQGKGNLLEEAVRVPLVVSYPGHVPSNRSTETPVSHLDVFATILDYVEASYFDQSDGTSLRPAMEQRRWNEHYDEGTVVVEREQRIPLDANRLSGRLGDRPNLLIRHGSYKLMVPKKADSAVLDMMYNLQDDPFEQHNLLGTNGHAANDTVVGKVEHLKLLLVEWLKRHDYAGYYSNPKFNLYLGEGDIREIEKRRTWRAVDYWQSDSRIVLGRPVAAEVGDSNSNGNTSRRQYEWKRNEYLYVGRTSPGQLTIYKILVEGPASRFVSVEIASSMTSAENVGEGPNSNVTTATRGIMIAGTPSLLVLEENQHVRLRVRFRLTATATASTAAARLWNSFSLEARILIHNDVNVVSTIPITTGGDTVAY